MKIELPLDGTSAAPLRAASEAVFKSRYLVEILLLIAQEDSFYHGQIVGRVPGAGGSFVSSVLTRYADAGLIRVMPAEDGQARTYYTKSEPHNPFWTLIHDWADFVLAGAGNRPQAPQLSTGPSAGATQPVDSAVRER